MTIDDLKRALVEVREVCNNVDFCGECPFGLCDECPIGMTIPGNWDVDDWKEGGLYEAG